MAEAGSFIHDSQCKHFPFIAS